MQNAPHTAAVVLDEEWSHPYSREQAAFPAAWVRQAKFWPAVSRVDNVYGAFPCLSSTPTQHLHDAHWSTCCFPGRMTPTMSTALPLQPLRDFQAIPF